MWGQGTRVDPLSPKEKTETAPQRWHQTPTGNEPMVIEGGGGGNDDDNDYNDDDNEDDVDIAF